MRTSLIISTLLHVAILAYALVGFAAPRDFKAKPPKPLPVEILSIEDFSKLTPGAKKEKPAKKIEKKKKKAKRKSVRPPPKAEPKKIEPAPKKTTPEKKEVIKAKKKVEKKKKAEKPKPKPKPKPKTKKVKSKTKKKFDSDDIAALLNKIPDAGQKKKKPKPKPKKTTKKTKGEGGLDKRLAASIGAQIKRRIENECWVTPIGGRNVDNLVVKISFALDKTGNVTGLPRIVSAVSGPAATAVAESAKRAILECQPYFEFATRLPNNYADWKSVTMNFDMREMYGN